MIDSIMSLLAQKSINHNKIRKVHEENVIFGFLKKLKIILKQACYLASSYIAFDTNYIIYNKVRYMNFKNVHTNIQATL